MSNNKTLPKVQTDRANRDRIITTGSESKMVAKIAHKSPIRPDFIVMAVNTNEAKVKRKQQLESALKNICDELPNPTLAVTKIIKEIAESALKTTL